MGKEGFEDFARELEDDGSVIKDVTLIGSDGGTVSASKALLAIRSIVFRRMFYGNFRESEANCDSVKLNYPAQVLLEVVRYCYTSETSFENSYIAKDSGSIALAITLVEAANYFQMKGLRNSVERMPIQRKFIFFILKELVSRRLTDGDLWLRCMKTLKAERKYWVLQPTLPKYSGICISSCLLLETIYDSVKEEVPASWLVKGLQSWNEANHSGITVKHSMRIQKLADDIDLQSMEIEELAQVQPCSLFSSDRLFKAMASLVKAEPSSQKPKSKRKRARGKSSDNDSDSDFTISNGF